MSFDYSKIIFEKKLSNWDYFPTMSPENKPEVLRMCGNLNNEEITFIDYFLKDDSIYILSAWTKKEYRNLGIMTYLGEYLYSRRFESPETKNIVWIALKENAKSLFYHDLTRFPDFNKIYDNGISPEVYLSEEKE